MKDFVLCLLLLLVSWTGSAQKTDSIFVKQHDNGWAVMHRVKDGETIFSVARRYHIPPAMLADANNLNYQNGLAAGRVLTIPLGAYNFINKMPEQMTDLRPLYFVVEHPSQLYRIARNSRVPQKNIQQWNGLFSTEILPGDILQVGWVLYDATPIQLPSSSQPKTPKQPQKTEPVKPVTIPVAPPEHRQNPVRVDTIAVAQVDTNILDTLSPSEKIFLQQTNNEQNMVTEKGPAAFFPANIPNNADYYFGFHNTAPKGSIIRVVNPGTQKTIFVKVLGPLPKSKMYHNCIVGISSDARSALLASEDKMWCEVSYAGY